MTDSERIKAIEEYTGLSTRALSLAIGIKTPQTLYDIHKGKHGISKGLARSITAKYLNINSEWLLTGEGPMLKPESSQSEVAFLTNADVMMVPLISKFAYAGYLAGYGDDEYVDRLPTVPFILPEDRTHRGQYVALEVKGDSMDDGTDASIKEGDVVLCRNIDRSLWQDSKLHLKKWNFVIVHKEGILIKRILAHDVRHGRITIHSLNPEYPDREIDLNDVARIMNVVQLQRKPLV